MQNLFPSLRNFGHSIIESAFFTWTRHGGAFVAVDATCGNGHDTLFLAHCLKKSGCNGCVYAFDVQQRAITRTQRLLEEHGLEQFVQLTLLDHEKMADYLAEPLAGTERSFAVAMYNLGYLPGSNKTIITTPQRSLVSLQAASELLSPDGLILVHAYGGHAGGLEEMSRVRDWFHGLPHTTWRAMEYSLCNKPWNPETLFIAAKKEHAP